MTVRQLFARLNERIPRSLSYAWDNDGLMCCPDGDREVRRVLVALDATAEVCERAIDGGYDVILTHHPFIFKGLKSLEDENAIALKAIKLIKEGIAVMSFHTRLDAVEGGVNDTLACELGLSAVESFDGEGLPIGRIGELDAPMDIDAFAGRVKDALGCRFVLVSDAGREVKRVAVLGGDGKDFISVARALGADTYVSGRLDYHSMTDSPDLVGTPINLIEAGHFYTEFPVCRTLCAMIRQIDPEIECDIVNGNRIKAIG